ncbi:transposase [Modestobacter sp. VKM Ac-2979]|nr:MULTISPECIES: transposase [unclassified Modestobacter]MCZ2811930.1 transposase [Modestobacter sp. VKM Ac-2979]MCZ2843653.1 transposase [Modestobacter sp. VKM Ac-2980]
MVRLGPGRPRTRPTAILGDRAYCSKAIRAHLRSRGIAAVIPEPRDQQAHRPRRGDEGGRPISYDRGFHKKRNVVEGSFALLEQWCGLATRYDEHALIYRGAAVLAAVLSWPERERHALGESIARVATSTGLGRKRVAKAAGVARLDEATAAAVTAANLTLDQVVAVYAEDPDTTAALMEAATPGQSAHALTRAKRAREEAERAAALLAQLTEAGRRVLDAADGGQLSRISQLAHDGADLTAGSHVACEESAVYLSNSWNGVSAVGVCTDPATYGHANRYSRIGMPPIPRPSVGSSVTPLGQLAGFIPPSTA